MKALSLSTPYLIVVVGIPGAGKTHFSRKFAAMFHTPLLSDEQLYHLDPEITPAVAQKLAPNLLETFLPEYLKTGQSIIIDGLVSMRNQRTDLHKAARNAGYNMLTVWVQTDPVTARRRCVRPDRQSDKTAISNEMYDEIVSIFSPPHPSEKCLVLSGKHTYATQARTLLRRLTETRSTPTVVATPKRSTTGNRISIG